MGNPVLPLNILNMQGEVFKVYLPTIWKTKIVNKIRKEVFINFFLLKQLIKCKSSSLNNLNKLRLILRILTRLINQFLCISFITDKSSFKMINGLDKCTRVQLLKFIFL